MGKAKTWHTYGLNHTINFRSFYMVLGGDVDYPTPESFLNDLKVLYKQHSGFDISREDYDKIADEVITHWGLLISLSAEPKHFEYDEIDFPMDVWYSFSIERELSAEEMEKQRLSRIRSKETSKMKKLLEQNKEKELYEQLKQKYEQK